MEFRLPELGEGIESATVTAVLVKPGDAVAAGQNVIFGRDGQGAVDVPVESAGTVGQIQVKPGDKVARGGADPHPQRYRQAGREDGTACQRPPKPAKPRAFCCSTTGEWQEAPVVKRQRSRLSRRTADFKLPALGEGIDAGTITAVLVKPGDAIKAGQNVVTIETDKAAVDVPAEADGVVEAIHVKPGDKVHDRRESVDPADRWRTPSGG